MIDFKAVNNLGKAIKWAEASEKQLPFSLSQALNKTAFEVQDAFKGDSKRFFDRPTPFIVKGWRYKKSNKRNLIVRIHPEKQRQGVISEQIQGGPRGAKSFEREFSATSSSVSNSNKYVPATAKLDRYGNVTKTNILKFAKLVGTAGKNSVFVGKPRGGSRSEGIYQRLPKGVLKPLFISTKSTTYNRRWNIKRVGDKVVDRRFVKYAQTFLDKNIRDQLAGR